MKQLHQSFSGCRNFYKGKCFGLALMSVILFVGMMPGKSFAGITITIPTNGQNICSIKAANGSSPAYTTLNTITFTEGLTGDFNFGNSGATLVLTIQAPVGWQFSSSNPSYTISGGDISGVTTNSISATQLKINVTGKKNNNIDMFMIIGLQVQATSTGAATGNITAPSAPGFIGINGTTNFATLSLQAASTPSVTIGANPTGAICSGASVIFTATPVNGGTTPTYQWKLNGSNVTGATAVTYTTSTLTNGDQVSVVMTSNATCVSSATATSAAITITVNQPPSITVQPSTAIQTLCQNAPATQLSVTATGAGLSYQWYSNASNSNVGGTLINLATSFAYTPVTSTSGTLYYYVIVSGTCSPSVTSAVSGAIIVNAPPAVTSQPSTTTQTLCLNAPATQLSVTATGAGLNYQWYSNTANSNVGGALINLATSSTYTPSTATPGTLYYYVTVSGTCPSSVTSAPSGAITVNAPPAITGQPPTTGQTICINGPSAQLSVKATGTGLNYQWYSNAANSNVGGTLISGATSSAYTPVTSASGTLYYYVIVSGTCTPAVSSMPSGAVTVNNPVVISTDPISQTKCSNTSVTFSVLASGTGTLTYKWYKSTNPTTPIANGPRVSGATTSDITLSLLNAANSGNYYVVVSDASSCSAVTSQQATLTVNQEINATGQPQGTQTLCEGSDATFTVSAQGTGPFNVQWYNGAIMINNGGRYSVTSNTDLTTLPFPTLTTSLTINSIVLGDNSNNYYVVISNPIGICPQEVSDDAELIVTPTVGTPATPTPSATTICQASAPTAYTTSSTNATSYTWTVTGTGNTVSGTGTTGTVTWAAGFSGTATVSVVANGCNGPSAAASTTVTVTPTVGTPATPTPSATTICQASAPTAYTTSATNATSYTWTVTGTGNTVSGTGTTGTVTWAAGFSGTATVSVVANGCNGPSAAASTTVTVTPTVGTPATPTPSATTICQASAPTAYTTSATNATSYTWTVTGTGNTVSGTGTTGTVTWAAGFSGTATVSVVANGCNGPSAAASTTVTVTPTVGAPATPTPSATTICQASAPTAYTTSATNATSYTWTVTGTGNTVSGTGTTGTVTWAAGFSGTATVSVVANGCSGPSAAASTTVTVTPTVGAPATPTPSATTICQASAPTAYTTSATNATSYTWTVSGTGNTVSGTGTTGTVTWAAGFSGTATVSVKANGCNGPSAAASTSVTVTATVGTPIFTLGATSSRCQAASTVTYGATSSNSTGITYTLDATTLAFAGNSIVSATGAVTYAAGWSGTSVITASAAGCNGPKTANHTVTVTAAPTVNAGTALISCKDASQRVAAFPLNITAGASATNYGTVTWSKGSGTGTLTNPNSLTSATYIPSAADISSPTGVTFTLTATGTGSCGSVFSTKTLTFTTAISGNTSIKAVPICSDGGYQIIPSGAPSGGDGTFSYLWEGEPNCGGGNGWPDLATSPSYIVPLGQEIFCFRSTITSGGCAVISNKGKLIDLAGGLSNDITFTGNTTICTGTSTVLTASSAVSYTYVWDPSPTLAPPLNSASVTASPTTGTTASTTTYKVTGTATDGTGCQKIGNVIVTVNPLPTITASASAASVCASNNAQTTTLAYSATTNSPNRFGITWNTTPSNSFATVNDAGITPSFLTINVPANTLVATYTGNLTVKNLTTGCVSNPSVPFNITVNALPTITTTGTVVPVCFSSGAQTTTMPYTATTNSPVSYSIDWATLTDQASTPFAFAAGGGTVTGIIIPAGTAGSVTAYSGIMTITNANGCTRTKEISLTVNPLPSITTASSAANVCFKATTQTTTLSYSAPTNFPTKYSITWNASPANSFLPVTDQPLPGSIIINVPANTPAGTYTGTVTVKNANNCVSSAGTNFTVTIDPVSVGGSVASVSSCAGGSGTLPLTGNVGSVVQWESSTTGGAPWTIITTTTTALPYTVTAQTMYYRALVKSGACTSAYSNIASVGLKNVWTGVTNSNWFTTSNWSDLQLPDFTTCPTVTIPQVLAGNSYPVIIAGTVVVKNIAINANASVSVTGGIIQISGTITNNGTFNVTNGTLDLNGSAKQTISGSMFSNSTLQNLKISNIGGVDISPTLNDTLNITGSLSFGLSSSTLNTGDNLTLKSSALATANVDQLAANNFITGKVNVERYLQAKRAWRFLAVPTNSTQTIKDTWQEGALSSGSNPHPGYGTQVTNAVTPTAGNGYDYYSPDGPSIKRYDVVNAVGTYAPYIALNATDNIATREGLMTFVRGDRTAIGLGATPTPVILRTKGSLNTGTQLPALSAPANQFLSVGNPYAAVLDMRNVADNNATNFQEFFYLWDPNGTGTGNRGFGSFQTFFRTNDGLYHATTPNGSYLADPYNYIQSGQGFFMHSSAALAGSLTLNESAKAVAPFSSPLVFRPAVAATEPILHTRILAVNADASANTIDGVVNIFGDAFSNSVDDLDAIKINNFSENLGINNNNKILVVERRHTINDHDTIQFNLRKVKVTAYRFEFMGENFDPSLTAFLEDSYLKTRKPLDLNATTAYNFDMLNIPEAYNPDRFRIVFATAFSGPLPLTFTTVKAHQQNNDIAVEWKVEDENNIKAYEVEKSTDGQHFTTSSTLAATANNGNNTSYQWLDVNAVKGNNYYRIKSTGINGEVKYSNIVKVILGTGRPQIAVYPNPVINGNINLQMINQPQGRYGLRLLNKLGQVIMIKEIEHQEGSSTESLKVKLLAHGAYNLEVTKPDKSSVNINVLY